jgi:hypothetical protein
MHRFPEAPQSVSAPYPGRTHTNPSSSHASLCGVVGITRALTGLSACTLAVLLFGSENGLQTFTRNSKVAY